MIEQFRSVAQDLRGMKSAQDIAKHADRVAEAFKMCVQEITSSSHSDKIQSRMLSKVEGELFQIGIDTLYKVTEFDPRGRTVTEADIERLDTLVEASRYLLSIRFDPNCGEVSQEDHQKFKHRVLLVTKNLHELATPQHEERAAFRDKYKKLATKVSTAATTLTQTYHVNKRHHSIGR